MINILKATSIHMQQITINPILEMLMTHIIMLLLYHLLAVEVMVVIQLGKLAYLEDRDKEIRLVDKNLILFKDSHLFGINNQPTNLRTRRNKNHLTIEIHLQFFPQVVQDLELML